MATRRRKFPPLQEEQLEKAYNEQQLPAQWEQMYDTAAVEVKSWTPYQAWAFMRQEAKTTGEDVTPKQKKAKVDADTCCTGSIAIFVDGSRKCTEGRIRAGWGYVAVQMPAGKYVDQTTDEGIVIRKRCGPVIVDKTHPEWLGAEERTNNTAELSAQWWSLKWIQEAKIVKAKLFYDSSYAAMVTQGVAKPKTNKLLALEVRQKQRAVSKDAEINFHHVRAHKGHWWNEKADQLANAGADMGQGQEE